LQKDQNSFMAIAWVISSERRVLELYPDTLFVDATEDTNKEGHPLLTIGGCDSSGKMFTFTCLFGKSTKLVVSLDFYACASDYVFKKHFRNNQRNHI